MYHNAVNFPHVCCRTATFFAPRTRVKLVTAYIYTHADNTQNGTAFSVHGGGMQGAEKISETPSPSDFVWTQTFKLAADRLVFAVRSKSPVILMLGQAGTGKTSLIQEILDNRLADFSVAYVGDPTILDAELSQTLRGALAEMRRTAPDDGGQAPVFIVDDAHRMLQTTLAKLVEYTNQKTSIGPALKLVLIADPDFEAVFRRILPGTAGPTFSLLPLPNEEAKNFITGKLAVLGEAADFLRDDEVERLIARSKGFPARLTRALEASIQRKSAQESAFGLDAAIKPRLTNLETAPHRSADAPAFGEERAAVMERSIAPPHRRRWIKLLLLVIYVVVLIGVAALLYSALGI